MLQQPQSVALRFSCLFLLLWLCGCAFSVPAFAVSNQYCESGTYSLITIPYYQNQLANDNPSNTFTAYLANSHPSYSAICSIVAIDFKITALKEINISVTVCTYAPQAMIFCMYSMRLSSLQVLSVRYLLLENTLASKLNKFESGASYYVNNQGTKPLSSGSSLVARIPVTAINMTGTLKVIVAFSGLNATLSDSTKTVDLQLVGSYQNSTTIKVEIKSASTTVLNVGSVMFCIIGYNVQQSQAWPFPAIIIMSYTFPTSEPLNDTTNLFQSYNTFWGLVYLKSKNQNNFTCDSNLIVQKSITGITVDSTALWTGIMLLLKFCGNSTPYYLISQDKCYDICPNFYYESTSDMLCKSCTSYDCLKCNAAGACTSCGSTRTLNGVTGSCNPLPGYFQSGSLVASACNSTCRTCSLAQSNCTSCFSGFYLSGSTCLACSASCGTCAIVSTNCTSCYSAFFISGSTCQPCVSDCSICSNSSSCGTCRSGYMLDAGGLCIISYNCSAIANCGSCTPPTGCLTCGTGYQKINITLCQSVCGDGSLSPVQQCDDNNTSPGDGCSSTCLIQQAYFCTGVLGAKSSCTKCLDDCMNCSNLVSCSLCRTYYVWNASTSGCVPNCTNVTDCISCFVSTIINCTGCLDGFKVDTAVCVNICGDGLIVANEQCDDNNTFAGDGCSGSCLIEDGFSCSGGGTLSVCIRCVGATFQSANKSVCLPCGNYDCATCKANGECLSCRNSSNRYLSNITYRCIPQNGFYDDGSQQIAQPCASLCMTCNAGGNNSCLSCHSGYVLLSNSCQLCTIILDANCITCKNSMAFAADCLSCNTGYIIKNNTCAFACGDAQINNGQECDDGNLISSDGCSSSCVIQDGFSCKTINFFSICVECVGAYFQSANKSACLPCTNFDCETCSINGDCLSCSNISNRYLDNITNRCLPNDGFYSFGHYEIAFPCDSQCLTCSAAGNKSCLSCHEYSVLVGNSCRSCVIAVDISCLTCSSVGSTVQCLSCSNGTLENGTCVIAPPLPKIVQKTKTIIAQANTSNLLLYIIAALGALLLCCCSILFCLWRRRKNEENKVEQQIQEEAKNQIEDKKSNLDQTLNVFNRGHDEIISEKEVVKKKRKFRTQKSAKVHLGIHSMKNPLRQETQENVLSLEEFKETLQFKKLDKNNTGRNSAFANQSFINSQQTQQPNAFTSSTPQPQQDQIRKDQAFANKFHNQQPKQPKTITSFLPQPQKQNTRKKVDSANQSKPKQSKALVAQLPLTQKSKARRNSDFANELFIQFQKPKQLNPFAVNLPQSYLYKQLKPQLLDKIQMEGDEFDIDEQKKSEIINEDHLQGVSKNNSNTADEGEKSEIHNEEYNKVVVEYMIDKGESKQNSDEQTSEKGI